MADFVYVTPEEEEEEAPPEPNPGREVGDGYPIGLRLSWVFLPSSAAATAKRAKTESWTKEVILQLQESLTKSISIKVKPWTPLNLLEL